MKKIIAWLLVLALTAAVSIGATLAYLTDTDEDVNVMTLGKVKIDQLEYERIDDESKNEGAEVQEFRDNKPLYPAITGNGFDYTPGDTYVDWEQIGKNGYTSDIWNPDQINNELDKMVFVKNKGDYDAYVRSVFAFEAGNYKTLDEFRKMVHLNLNGSEWTWDWLSTPVTIGQSTYFIATATYNEKLVPGALTEISLSQIALDKTATNADVEAFGETYQVLVKSQAIQADGFTDPNTALNEGFGVIDGNTVPWEHDNPNRGGDLKTALHYLNGDPAGTQITASVTNIVFGKNAEYPEIVNNHKGFLVDQEQDTDVYVYYIDNSQLTRAATGYTVYVLSDGIIYAPKDSSKLFNQMNALETVNVEKLNTSRAETLWAMFQKCIKLKSLDVSTWDTSKVTDMAAVFVNCNALETLTGTEKWDTSSVLTMRRMFEQCNVLDTVNCTGWDVSKVTTNEQMFYKCYKLTEIAGIEKWVLSATENTYRMFMNCEILPEIDASSWDLRSLVNARDMFKYCYALKEIKGMGNWNTGKLESLWDTFALCWALESLEGLQNWDLSSAIKIAGTFQQCRALTDQDIEVLYNWDMSHVEDISWMFKGATGLVNIDLSNWDTSNIKKLNSMFSSHDSNTGSMNIKTTGIENWNVSNADNISYMFYGCGQLESLDLSQWDVSKVTTTYHMFADCYSVSSLNFTGWNTASLTNMDGMFNDCHKLVTLDVSDFDTANVTDISQIFEGCCSLKEIIGFGQWDVSNVVDAAQLFNANGTTMQIEVVDLSGWDTSKVTGFDHAFNGCGQLKTIYVGDGWDTSKVTSYGAMFSGCSSLVGGAGTTFVGTDLKYAHVDGGVDNPGYLTYKAPATTNP